MWSLIEEVTTGKQRLVLVIVKLTPIMWSSSSINTQCFGHLKSSSNLKLINGKSRDLQKLLKYFNGTISSVFNDSIGGRFGRDGWFPCSSGPS